MESSWNDDVVLGIDSIENCFFVSQRIVSLQGIKADGTFELDLDETNIAEVRLLCQTFGVVFEELDIQSTVTRLHELLVDEVRSCHLMHSDSLEDQDIAGSQECLPLTRTRMLLEKMLKRIDLVLLTVENPLPFPDIEEMNEREPSEAPSSVRRQASVLHEIEALYPESKRLAVLSDEDDGQRMSQLGTRSQRTVDQAELASITRSTSALVPPTHAGSRATWEKHTSAALPQVQQFR